MLKRSWLGLRFIAVTTWAGLIRAQASGWLWFAVWLLISLGNGQPQHITSSVLLYEYMSIISNSRYAARSATAL